MTFGEGRPGAAQGQIAQQIFWYTAFTADMTKPGLPVVNADGTPSGAWPRPERPVLEAGHAERLPGRGLVDLLHDHAANRTAAAWLYAQFVTSKTTSLEEDGGRPDLRSAIRHPSSNLTEWRPSRRPGEFYRSPGAWPGRPPAPTCPTTPSWPALVEERGRRR